MQRPEHALAAFDLCDFLNAGHSWRRCVRPEAAQGRRHANAPVKHARELRRGVMDAPAASAAEISDHSLQKNETIPYAPLRARFTNAS